MYNWTVFVHSTLDIYAKLPDDASLLYQLTVICIKHVSYDKKGCFAFPWNIVDSLLTWKWYSRLCSNVCCTYKSALTLKSLSVVVYFSSFTNNQLEFFYQLHCTMTAKTTSFRSLKKCSASNVSQYSIHDFNIHRVSEKRSIFVFVRTL